MTFIPGLGYVFSENRTPTRSRESGTVVHTTNVILDPLKECNVAEWIVEDSPETVESWAETQVRLGNMEVEKLKYIQETRIKGKPFHQLKEKTHGKNI